MITLISSYASYTSTPFWASAWLLAEITLQFPYAPWKMLQVRCISVSAISCSCASKLHTTRAHHKMNQMQKWGISVESKRLSNILFSLRVYHKILPMNQSKWPSDIKWKPQHSLSALSLVCNKISCNSPRHHSYPFCWMAWRQCPKWKTFSQCLDSSKNSSALIKVDFRKGKRAQYRKEGSTERNCGGHSMSILIPQFLHVTNVSKHPATPQRLIRSDLKWNLTLAVLIFTFAQSSFSKLFRAWLSFLANSFPPTRIYSESSLWEMCWKTRRGWVRIFWYNFLNYPNL